MAYSFGQVSGLKLDTSKKLLSEEKEILIKSLGEK